MFLKLNRKLNLIIFIVFYSLQSNAQISILKDINIGKNNSNPSLFSTFNNKLVFKANDGIHGSELWISNGTPLGTILLKDINPGAFGSNIGNLITLNNFLFFIADNGVNGYELWTSDGTELGTKMLLDINSKTTGSVDPYSLKSVENEITFLADDGITGMQLWASDGTASGTHKITNLVGGMIFKLLDKINNKYIFQYNDTIHSRELWVSDGTSIGTILLKDINSGKASSLIKDYIRYNDILLFTAFDSLNGFELWRTDGSPNGTFLIKDILKGNKSAKPEYFSYFENKIIFSTLDSSNNSHIWQTDGSNLGTTLYLKSKNNLHITNIITALNTVYFEAADSLFGSEIRYKDNNDSIQLLFDINLGSSSSFAREMTVIDSLIYFSATDKSGWNSIWATKGLPINTYMFSQINNVQGNRATDLINLDKSLYFKGFKDSTGYEVFTNNPLETGLVFLDMNSLFEIYPVPSKHRIFIKGNNNIRRVACYNSEGKLIQSKEYDSIENLVLFDVSILSAGLYTIEILDSNLKISLKKIIIN